MWPIAKPVVVWFVCLFETFVIHAKMAEPIKARFVMWIPSVGKLLHVVFIGSGLMVVSNRPADSQTVRSHCKCEIS